MKERIVNMCIIASIPKGVGTISESTLETMANNNSHGFGISWIDDNNIINTFKSMENKKFIEKALDIQNKFSKKSDILIHCRIATSGKTNLANCHPFEVNKNTVFAHNGVLDCVEPTKNMSDTRVFNNTLLKNLKDNFLSNKGITEFLGEIIGTDKLVFLTNNPAYDQNTFIINPNQGETVDGIWFSNTSYKSRSFVNSYTYNGVNYEYHDPYYGYDNASCSITNQVQDMEEIVLEYGSINDYLMSNYDTSFDKEYKDIVQDIQKTEKNNEIIISIPSFENRKLFDNVSYKTEYIVTDKIKKLLMSMYDGFSINMKYDELTNKDWNRICWDCFGIDLPIKVTRSDQRVFSFNQK